SMLEPYQPEWKQLAMRSSEDLEEGERFYVLRGAIEVATPAAKERVLEGVGSRLVFLIDWNKARKRLRNFLPNRVAVSVLENAARMEVGHMAFLKMGGDELIYQALDVAATEYLRHGEPFHTAVKNPIAIDCFTEILKICREGIDAEDSIQVVRDRIVASLTQAFMSKIRGNLGACRKQAGLVVESALTLEQILRFFRLRKESQEFYHRSRERIAGWENEADDILNRVRRKESQKPSGLPVRELSGSVDDALDNIDQAAYYLDGLRYRTKEADAIRALSDTSAILVRCAQEFYKALSAASEASSRRSQEDLPEFFESIGRLDQLTKKKNARQREFLETIFEMSEHSGLVARLREIEGRISVAVDSLSSAGFLLYDSIFTPGQIGN
ncbi:MAG: hypothetical protein JXA90_15545, partial [Planctomycetes bacterium]|nr:hypothetical protein [Planctomycetota bacterium]